MNEIKDFLHKHWAKIVAGFVVFIACAAFFGSADAQECIPEEGVDGPIATRHSAVKKPGDAVTVSWVLPSFTEACEPLTGELALSAVEFYASAAGPVLAGDPPTATLPAGQTSVQITADSERGANIYYAVRACNDFDCSSLSNQEFVKIPGRPKNADVEGAD